MAPEPDSYVGYRIAGVIYLLLGAPGLAALLLGKLQRGGDPYFALSGGLVVPGLLFLLYGMGRWPLNGLSEGALKMSVIALIQPPFLLLFHRIMQSDPGFGTAYQFTGMFLGFLGGLSSVLLVGAMTRGRRPA